jgi:hypothetical protein
MVLQRRIAVGMLHEQPGRVCRLFSHQRATGPAPRCRYIAHPRAVVIVNRHGARKAPFLAPDDGRPGRQIGIAPMQ